MNQTWILLSAVLVLFVHCSTVISVPYVTRGACKVDANNKSITIRNLKENCSNRQLQNIFFNLSIGPFPNGKLKGYVALLPVGDLLIETLHESIWHGKNFYYARGAPHDHGIVLNNFLGIQFLRATIYRTVAPIDGKEAYAIDYKNEFFAFLMIDYVRLVQKNLHLGYVAIRGFERNPIAFFLLESA